MPIIVSNPITERGKKDARRHREKQKEVIREKLPEIIAEESIITKKKGKIVKVPIKMLDIPHFRPKKDGMGGYGVGQGQGKPGDVIGHKPGQGKQPGQAGDEPGVDYIETEIDLEELIAMAMEDLGLPNIQEKTVEQLEVILGFKISGLSRSGPWVLLDRRATAKEGMRRFWHYLNHLKKETDRSELECFEALKHASGLLDDALKLLEDPGFKALAEKVEPFPILTNEDLRYVKLEEDKQKQSNAVVIAMMDVSGSMSINKKYFARSFLFWLVEFLRKLYDNVEIRFIIHHTDAKLVDEHTFFHTGESGGTYCYKAYELANTLIETEYPTDRWNVYPFHFSDGEDFSPERSVEEARKLFDKGINMFGYGEIHVDSGYKPANTLVNAFYESFPIEEVSAKELDFFVGKKEFPFIGVIIENKEQLWPALREFLKKERWS